MNIFCWFSYVYVLLHLHIYSPFIHLLTYIYIILLINWPHHHKTKRYKAHIYIWYGTCTHIIYSNQKNNFEKPTLFFLCRVMQVLRTQKKTFFIQNVFIWFILFKECEIKKKENSVHIARIFFFWRVSPSHFIKWFIYIRILCPVSKGFPFAFCCSVNNISQVLRSYMFWKF